MRIGVDGCKKGWFYFQFDAHELSFGLVSQLSDLLRLLPDDGVVLVDIPIGLKESNGGMRRCDAMGKKLLAPTRTSSVFPVPSRQAVYASSYEQASAVNKQVLGKRISKQSWAITPKIREIDELLQRSAFARSTVREVHPELCFWGLRGNPMCYSKKTREGFKERLEVLSAHFAQAPKVTAEAFLEHGGYGADRDDILDVLVAAFCASRIEDCRTVPEEPERDPRGLPMEIVYLPQETV